jgi:hypothetical protein
MMSTGTSCGDQIRQSMLDTGINFIGETTGLLIESVVTNMLTGSDQAATQQ